MSYYLIEIKKLLVELETSQNRNQIIEKLNNYIKLLEEDSKSFSFTIRKEDE
jgi:hypothetical protein